MKEIPVKTVLLAENNQEKASSICKIFDEQGLCAIELEQAASMADTEKHLARRSTDLVLLGLGLPDAQGREAVRRIRAIAPRVSIVLLSGLDDEATALQAMEEGAQDYIIEGQIGSRELMRTLHRAMGRKLIEDALFKEIERAQITLDSIGDALICTDLAGNVSFLNPIAERMTGWSLQRAAGRPLAEVFNIMDATTRMPLPNPISKLSEQNEGINPPKDCILVRPDGNGIFIEDSIAPIRNHDGMAVGSVMVFHDVTAARIKTAKITRMAEHDPLTGVPNRLLLTDRIDQAIARAHRDARQIAVLFMDLDNFKQINDTLGHLAGDKLLQSVAKRLLECVRTPDTVSRQGGDEFVLLLQDVNQPEDAAVTARRILKSMADTHFIDGHEIPITASIGVSIYPSDGQDAETLIKHADRAMYEAKAGGHHTFRFFRPQMNVRAMGRQSIEEDLRHACEGKELRLHYQPRIDLRTGAITGAEALLRWTHSTRGPVSPARFISVAEDSRLILSIGAWVLREACTQARAWADAGLRNAAISVNISAMQFQNANFLRDLFAMIDETGVYPRNLELEVTESILMKHAELMAPILKALEKKGVRVSVDDFGTGYSSLSYLQKFPLDALKIDRSFIHRITTNPAKTSIVNAIIGMARNLKLRVVAEGVETAEELAFLMGRECDEAQGYYFSRPMPAAKFYRRRAKLRTFIAESTVFNADADARPYSSGSHEECARAATSRPRQGHAAGAR
jgi:diguanylate cyclase (GGDEF)-like protein/PAS domain S-box-containing protein